MLSQVIVFQPVPLQRLLVQATVKCAGRTNLPGTSPCICAYRGQRQRRYNVEDMEGGEMAESNRLVKAQGVTMLIVHTKK